MTRIRALLDRLFGLADEPADDDDMRLRKRVLVIAGRYGTKPRVLLAGCGVTRG